MVKCADCGYLTMRNLFSGQLDEMDSEFRETGNPPRRRVREVGGMGNRVSESETTPYRHVPLCFDQQCRLADEITSHAELRKQYPDLPAAMLLEVINKDRNCPGFTPWQQGFTPKEHREMLDRRWMIEREDRRDEEMRRREDRRDQELRRLQERLHSRELWIMGGAVTVALIVSSVIAAVIEGAVSRGWQPAWWPF